MNQHGLEALKTAAEAAVYELEIAERCLQGAEAQLEEYRATLKVRREKALPLIEAVREFEPEWKPASRSRE